MNNELKTTELNFPLPVPKQEARNIFNAKNIDNINQNLTVIFTNKSKQKERININFNDLDYTHYNLITVGNSDLKEDKIIIPANKALTKNIVDAEIYNKLSNLSPKAIEQIKKYPAIITGENTEYNGKTDIEQQAYLCLITDINIQGNGICIEFIYLNKSIPQQLINDNASMFGIQNDTAITELNHTQWSIKKVNLREVLQNLNLM